MPIKIKFPFLVGRIRVSGAQQYLSHQAGFPFLVGRIRVSIALESCKESNKEFPFLVGRIRVWKDIKITFIKK